MGVAGVALVAGVAGVTGVALVVGICYHAVLYLLHLLPVLHT